MSDSGAKGELPLTRAGQGVPQYGIGRRKGAGEGSDEVVRVLVENPTAHRKPRPMRGSHQASQPVSAPLQGRARAACAADNRRPTVAGRRAAAAGQLAAGVRVPRSSESDGKPAPADGTDLLHFRLQAT
ncbi:hypothetical protein GCM10010350_22390 [Streptomyces galilaeus]|nr:hypothetical protein GCM10010350_22390 [Streptomyces galilaeus]